MTPNITVRHFPDKLPIGVSPDGRRHAFLYLLVSPLADDFRVFLRRHAELLRALPAWSVQLLVPVKQTDKDGRAQRLAEVYEERLPPGVRDTARSGDGERAALVLGCQTMASGPLDERRMRRARRIFGTPRFRALRRALELDGQRAVDVASSRGIADAIARADGRLERHDMRRQYFRLSHLVGTA